MSENSGGACHGCPAPAARPGDDPSDRPLEVALGIGCQRGAGLDTLAGAVAGALRDLGPVRVRCLASHVRRADEPALLALALARGWSLAFYSAERLASVPVPNPSARVALEVATPSVAEAAALLAGGASGLLVAKRAAVGPDGKGVTVAVARWCEGGSSSDPIPDPSAPSPAATDAGSDGSHSQGRR